MTLIDRHGNPLTATSQTRSANTVNIAGNTYPLSNGFGHGFGSMMPNPLGSTRPQMSGDLHSLANVVQPHSVVSGAIVTRALLMSQLWFRWRDTQTHNMFGDSGLAMFERPEMPRWLMQWEQMASLTGNVFIYRDDARDRLKMLRSDWVRVVLGSNADPAAVEVASDAPQVERKALLSDTLDAEVVGYIYMPPMQEPEFIAAEYVAHWMPEPHPLSDWLGASWVTSIIRELQTDLQVDEHTDKFFEQGATPQLVFTLDKDMPVGDAQAFKDVLDDSHSGLTNAWRAMYVGGGTDVNIVGSKLSDLGLGELEATKETRIASRARIPAAILGISAGLSGSTLNAGNYGEIRRMLADGFYTPHASGLARCLEHITPAHRPRRGFASGYLGYDPARVTFLQQDEKDAAEILSQDAGTVQKLWNAGFEADACVDAATTRDMTKLLGKHSGLEPVQAQKIDNKPKEAANNAA